MDRTRLISRLFLGLYIIAVAVLCFSRFNSGLDLSATWMGIPKDKIVHFSMFFPYPILMYLAFFTGNTRPLRLVLFLVAVILIGGTLAGVTELIQGELKYRSADIMDFRADCLGILTGTIITFIVGVITIKRKK